MKKGIKKRNSVKVIIFLVTLAVILITAGFSAFQASLNIGEIGAVVRLQKDIRVTGMTLNSRTNGAVSKYEAYSVKKVSSTMDLPNSNSTVTYDVEITNIGNVEIGLLDIIESFKLNGNNSSNLEIKSINGYDLENTSMLCDDNDNSLCKLGSVTTLEITIGYTNNGYNSSNTEYEMELEFDFKRAYTISYSGLTSDSGLPTVILDSETKVIEFQTANGVPSSVSVSGATGSYNSPNLTLSNPTSNVVVTASMNSNVEVVTNPDGSTTTTTTETTTDPNTGDSTTTVLVVNTDSNGNETSSSLTETTTSTDGSSTSTTTNYDANGDETGHSTSETDTSGNTSTQEVTVVNGNEVVTGYTIDTSNNSGGGLEVDSGVGVDTGVIALDGNPFTIHLVAKVAINKSTSGTNGNGGRVVVSALEPTASGASTYKGFAFFVEKSNNKLTLYASSSSSIRTGNSGATWGSKLNNCSATASNTTYTQHTIDITYTPGSGNSGGTISLTLDGTRSSVTSTTIPSALSNATITVGTLGVEHTRDIVAMEIIEFSVNKTVS